MPFHIEPFMGSPIVQAMKPAARMGYIYLLAAMWQSEDCTIPNDEEELSILSGLHDDWPTHARMILRCMNEVEPGRLTNQRQRTEWMEAKRIFESRRDSARSTNTSRSANGDRSGNRNAQGSSPSRPTDTVTGTETKTDQEPKFKTLAIEPATSSRENLATATPPPAKEADPRHVLCRDLVHAYWKHSNGDDKAPWDGSEGKALDAMLVAKPDLTPDAFKQMLWSRSRSDTNQAERPRKWLANLTDYAGGPLDRFGKPLSLKSPEATVGMHVAPAGAPAAPPERTYEPDPQPSFEPDPEKDATWAASIRAKMKRSGYKPSETEKIVLRRVAAREAQQAVSA